MSRLFASRPGTTLAALIALFLALVAANWIGFLASDDVTYARGAYGWIEQFPFVGGHGTIRYPITIPMALSFSLFGENEYAMVLPSLLAMLVAIVIGWRIVAHYAGTTAAVFAILLWVTCPLLVIQSSIASVDIVEMALILLALALTLQAQEDGQARHLWWAGVAIGIAFLTRETAIFVAPFFGILFLAGYRLPRWRYLWVAAGFVVAWSLELIYLGIMTGDPLYRFNISLHHDSSIDRSVDLAGNLIVHPLIDPLLVIFANQEFMLLFPLAIPLGLWLAFSSGHSAELRHFARMVGGFGLMWFICVGAAQTLLPLNPRYFMITTVAAIIIAGVGLAQLARKRLAVALMLALVGTNGFGVAVENKDSQFGERTIARIARERPGAVLTTDPMSRYRADLLLRWEGAADRVKADPPAGQGFYIYNPRYADTPNARMNALAAPAYRRPANWIVVARYEPTAGLVARGLEIGGLSKIIPPGIWQKLRYRHPPVELLAPPP